MIFTLYCFVQEIKQHRVMFKLTLFLLLADAYGDLTTEKENATVTFIRTVETTPEPKLETESLPELNNRRLAFHNPPLGTPYKFTIGTPDKSFLPSEFDVNNRPNRVNNRHDQNEYSLQLNNKFNPQYSIDHEDPNTSFINGNHRYRSQLMNRYDLIEKEQREILKNHPYFKLALRDDKPNGVIPNYIESLKKLDDAFEELYKHLVFDKNTKDEIHYLTILSVIDTLTTYMMKCLDDSEYENNFYELTNKAILEAISYPQGVSRKIKFKIDDVNSNIIQIKDLINNPYVKAACENVSKSQCDTILLAIMHVSGNRVLLSQADLLVNLGELASLFLDNYALEFNSVAASKHEVEYVLAAVHRLKPLIEKLSKSFGLIHPETSCENRARIPDHD